MLLNKNKKAQVSQTIIWTVSTLIIVTVLIISLFVTSNFLAPLKKVTNAVNSFFTVTYSKTTDLFAQKSLDSYLLTNENGIVYEQIKNEGNLNDNNGNLAKGIFPKLYGMSYKSIWVGILNKPNQIIQNSYFPTRSVHECALGFSQEIKLNAEKYLLLTLTGCSN
jgi:hypothetical protein